MSVLYRIYLDVVDGLRARRSQHGWEAEQDRDELARLEDLYDQLSHEERERADREGWRSWPDLYDRYMEENLVERADLLPNGARFYVIASRRDNADAEWVTLQNELLPVLGHAIPLEMGLAPGTVPTTRAVVVTKERTPRGYEYRLEDTSRQQLEALGVPPPHSMVSVSVENYDQFEVITGRDFEAEVVPFLAKIPLSNLDALGGAEVRDATTGAALWVSEALRRSKSEAQP